MNNDSTFNNRKQPVYNGNGKVVGYILGDTLSKKVSGEKHMLRSPKGWAWDTDILESAEKQGATKIEIQDTQSGKVYRATVKDFWDYGVGFNRGYGDQIVLCIQFWVIIDPNEPHALQLQLAI